MGAEGLIVDTSGPALLHLVEEPHESIFLLRMDTAEAEELAGRAMPDRADTADFARSLVDKGVARNVIIARVADGSVLTNTDGNWHSAGAKIEVVSKVGAGDSFVGAFTLAAARQDPLDHCLRYGVAAASAACTTEGTRLCDKDHTDKLVEHCTLQQI